MPIENSWGDIFNAVRGTSFDTYNTVGPAALLGLVIAVSILILFKGQRRRS